MPKPDLLLHRADPPSRPSLFLMLHHPQWRPRVGKQLELMQPGQMTSMDQRAIPGHVESENHLGMKRPLRLGVQPLTWLFQAQHQIMSPSVTTRCLLNPFRDGVSTTTLGRYNTMLSNKAVDSLPRVAILRTLPGHWTPGAM